MINDRVADIQAPVQDSRRQTMDALHQVLKQAAVVHGAEYVAVCCADELGVEGDRLSACSHAVSTAIDHACINEIITRHMNSRPRKPIEFIPDIAKSSLSSIDSICTSGVRSVALIPLDLPSAPDAALVMLWFKDIWPGSPVELESLIFYGRLMEVLCKNVLVIKTSQEQARKLSALVELSTTIYSSLNYQTVLHKVIDLATSLVNASHATIYILKPEGRKLRPLLTNQKSASCEILERELIVGKGAEGQAASRGEGVIVNGLSSESGDVSLSETGSRIAVPLTFSGNTIGVLSVHRSSGALFTLEDLQFLSIFARQAADVIENARMFKDLQEAYNKLSQTQEQMLETEKLRVLGEMACGVAHDFNNNLGAILGRTELLQTKTDNPELLKGLKDIERLALVGAETVKRTQEFARVRSKTAKKRVTVNEVIQDAIDTTRPLWKDQAQLNLVEIEMVTDLRAKVPIAGSADELVDAIANMIQNSVEALPNGGTIEISTYDRDREVVVEISDDGVGMSPEIQEKVFYPFFSSKGKGKTGLGMSVAYGILTRHQAAVEIDSEEGRGTRITLIFAARPELGSISQQSGAAKIQKTLNVLLVDDDESLLAVVSELLKILGHTPTTAGDGLEALSKFDENRFDLVITDLGLPGMSGWDIADAIKLKSPTLPVIIISGWGAQIGDSELRSHSVDLVLSKPFTMKQLKEAISNAFDTQSTVPVEDIKPKSAEQNSPDTG